MNLTNLFNKYNIINSIPISKGFSSDKKFILTSNQNNKYLLRISDISLLEKKKNQFNLLQQLEDLDINISKIIEYGTFDDNTCYMLLTYLEGIDAREIVKTLSDQQAYNLGIDAGKILQKIHNIKITNNSFSWYENYLIKQKRKINALLNSKFKIPHQEKLLKYYIDNTYLMKDRPLVICHSDYHLGNMIINDKKIGIIDFDKMTIADPIDEFKPFCWNVKESEYFETGLINGYYDNNVPNEFFKLLKYYTVESMISHLPWAINFGDEEVKIMQEINENQLKWWNNFDSDIPIWYKGICFTK